MRIASWRMATRVLAPCVPVSAASNIGGKPEAYRVGGARRILLLSNSTVPRMPTPLP
jgi:hypothetical protein